MHFIVTGGAGFIGSNLTRELQSQHPGAWISVVDDFSSGSYANLIGFGGDVIASPCEELDWDRQFGHRSVSCIYHLASITDTTRDDQQEMLQRNVEGFRQVLEFALSRGTRVVYASSAATYGLSDRPMTEDQAPAPANVYGFSKCILDNLARRAALDGLPVLGLRYFNVYGPREEHKGRMASMILQLYGQIKAGEAPRLFRSGEQRRDFVYVEDVVAATILAGEQGEPGVYNAGSGTARSFKEVVAILSARLGSSLQTQYIDNPHAGSYQDYTEADLTLAREALGYEPLWSLEQGIADYLRWLEAGSPTAAWASYELGRGVFEEEPRVALAEELA